MGVEEGAVGLDKASRVCDSRKGNEARQTWKLRVFISTPAPDEAFVEMSRGAYADVLEMEIAVLDVQKSKPDSVW